MSYRCDVCSSVRNGGELKLVAEVRNVNYDRSFMRFDRRDKKKVAKYDTTFKGSEIVEEERLCETCYEERKDYSPKVNRVLKTVKFIGTRIARKDDSKSGDGNIDISGLKEKFERRR